MHGYKIISERSLLLIGIIVYFSVCFFFHLYDHAQSKSFKATDALEYEQAADLLYQQNFIPHPTRTIGYPLIIGLPELFSDSKNLQHNFIYLFQFVLWLLTLLLIYKTLIRHASQKIAFIAGLLFIANVSNIIYSVHTLTDTAFSFLLVLFAWLFDKYLSSRKTSALILAMLALCFSCLVRPISLYLSILFLFFSGYHIIRYHTQRVKNIFLVLIIFCGTIGIQFILIYKTYNIPTISLISGKTAYHYINARSESFADNTDLKEVKEKRLADEEVLFSYVSAQRLYIRPDSLYKADFNFQLKNNTGSFIKAYLFDLFDNTFAGNGSFKNLPDYAASFAKKTAFKYTVVENLLYVLLMGILIIIVFRNFLKHRMLFLKQHLTAIVCAACCLYLFLLSGFSFWQGDRFVNVFVPLLLIAGGLLLFSENEKRTVPENNV